MCYVLIRRLSNLDISKNREEEEKYLQWAAQVITWELQAIYGGEFENKLSCPNIDWDLGKVKGIK